MANSPYLLCSDLHLHAWSAFGATAPDGMNSRLKIQLDELMRAAVELKKRGGSVMVIAGDLFHVRGSVDPEVFNPAHTVFTEIVSMGISIFAIPGNHDLKGKETTAIGNSFQTMNAIANDDVGCCFEVITAPLVGIGNKAFVPWCSTKDKLRETVAELAGTMNLEALSETDLIIHVGIDGVLDGVPAGGLSAVEVAGWGFKRVFAGDYHNFKEMEGGKVVSIGATTHQTWSDINSRAGFLFVYEDKIEHLASHAPNFVEITGDDAEEEIPLIVDGNFVRIRSMKLSDPEVTAFRKSLESMGAKGVTFQIAREVVSAREGAPAAGTATTLDASVDQFIDTIDPITIDVAAVKAGCADVLSTIRSVAA
jgi:DNA repair exonuclease SbcCD nuclease subunit